ncbi:MAG: flippase activity-associated protein Agl23 [Tepidisphaerales bacterium]
MSVLPVDRMCKWLTIAAVVLITIGAFAFRKPRLDLRIFHQDEAIHCYRLQEIRVEGVYKYIPSEYHGPTLNYFTFPVLWLTGANDWLKATEWHYRMVTVFFGTALVLSVLLLRDGLGNVATVFAALLVAVSPAMVFYSRYYIQEMLLVFFMALAIGAGWRWSRSQRWGWLVILGASIGFMHATKETFIINLFSAAVGVGAAWVMTRGARSVARASSPWCRYSDTSLSSGKMAAPAGILRPRAWIITLATAAVVSVVLFSSFFHYWRGVVDSILTYKVYFSRGAGVNTDHVHEWWYYFQVLFWHESRGMPVRTEMAIPALALVGFAYALWPRRSTLALPSGESIPQLPLPSGEGRGEGLVQSPLPKGSTVLPGNDDLSEDRHHRRDACATDCAGRLFLLRWLAIYTLVLMAVYCRISYKTPWCALGFLHGMILLAGVGAAAIIHLGGRVARCCAVFVARAASPSLAVPRGGEEIRASVEPVSGECAGVPAPRAGSPCHDFQPGAVITQTILAVILLLPIGFMRYKNRRFDLAYQAYDYSFNPKRVAASPYNFNPHIYGHTSTKVRELIERVNEIARVWPAHEKISIEVTTNDCWPVPWYLRQYMNARFPGVRPFVSPALVITNARKNEVPLPADLEENYRPDYFGLRREELLILHVRNDVWAKFIESRRTPAK